MRTAAAILVVSCLLAAPGCKPKCPEMRLSLGKLVAEQNANAGRIERLWARAKIRVEMPGGLAWGSTSPLAAPNGRLLLQKSGDPLGPQDFVLIGGESLAMDLFRIGSSTAEGIYYFWYSAGPRGGQAWWGRHEFAGAPGVKDMPIEANQLLSVLGVCALPADFTKLPTVALSMSRDPCAYVLTYIDRQPLTGRILFRREIFLTWDDKRPPRPFRINLFDNTGRRIMTARVKNYRPVEAAAAAGRPPVMPTDIEIAWPEKKSKVHIALSEMTTEDKWDVSACRFRDADTGELPGGLSPGDVVQVDADLTSGGPTR